jgi:hypothetical protein
MTMRTATGPYTLLIDSCYVAKALMCDTFDAACLIRGTASSTRTALDECYDLRRPWFEETDRLVGQFFGFSTVLSK